MLISIIIPVYNEEHNIDGFYTELAEMIKSSGYNAELVFVDDGSVDNSNKILSHLASIDKTVKLVTFNRNYGQTQAIAAGIKHSKGEVIVLMDSDLQNDPKDVPNLVKQLDNADVVSGWRKIRKDNYLTRVLPSKIANSLISFMTGVKLHDYGCSLKTYKREYLDNLSIHGEIHRFLPAYCSWQGAKIAEVVVNHRPRKYGKSNYGLARMFKVILDLLTIKFLLSYLTKPIYVFGGAAIISFLAGSVIYLFVIIRKLVYHGDWLSPLFFMGFLLWFLSVLCLFLGLIAEVLVRMYFESRSYLPYRIKEKINL
jgi:glycosyltransferase involved in cell wall biosynthesis